MHHGAPWTLSRRELVAGGAALAGLGWVGSARASARTSPSDDDLLDAGLARLAARFPDVRIHRSNHAPMVAETLWTLGRADAIAPWLDANLDAFERDERARRPIDREGWRAALGDGDRNADWQVFFLAELERDGAPAVLRAWVPRLAPGLAGVATHGVIRAAHAARALAARDCEIRRFELACGLAYWASNYEELPWDKSVAPAPSVEAALATVAPRRPAHEAPGGNIVSGLRVLRETPSFLPVGGRIDVRDPAATLSAMAATFARVYLSNPERRIAFTHAVTAPSALRLLAPYLDDETLQAGVRYAWQAAAGLYAVYHDPRGRAPEERAVLERDVLVATALETGGAHAIKLTEACLREHALAPAPVLLAAARDAAERQTA